MASAELFDRLGSLSLVSTRKIIVGVDYGTTYTGDLFFLSFTERAKLTSFLKAPVL